MFAGRYRPNRKDGQPAQAAGGASGASPGAPLAEPNSRYYAHPAGASQQATGAFAGDADDGAPLPQLVADVMSVVRLNWDFMSSPEFNPIPYALSLLDESSLGRNFNTFCEVHDTLERAMDLIINEYHQSFNSAIQTFSSVVDTIDDSRSKVQQMRENLELCKDWLECKRLDVFHLWVKSVQFKEMSRILDTIDDLQKTHARIETLIEGKYFLTAVRTLTTAIRTIDGPDFSEIGALAGIRDKLSEIKKSVFDTIVEELTDHIYLKTNMSSARQEFLAMITRQNVEVPDGSEFQFFSEAKIDHVRAQIKPEISDDFEANPELDPFRHMQAMIESLAIIERLPDAIKCVKERLSQELYNVVEKVIQEIEVRHTANTFQHFSMVEAAAVVSGSTEGDASLFGELLLTLYDRFEAIALGHLFCLTVSEKLMPNKNGDSGYTMAQICSTIQSEVKALLYDYLTTTEKASTATGTVVSMNEVLRGKRRGNERIAKQIYRINGATPPQFKKMVDSEILEMISEYNDGQVPETISTMPGLGIVDKYANTTSAGHKLIVQPEATNILVAYKPTLQFNTKLEVVCGLESGGFGVYLEDFVLSVYLPNLQDKIIAFYHNCVNGIDAFQTEIMPGIPFPLVKSAIALGYLAQTMRRAVHAIPVHREEFMRTLEALMDRFHEKCQARFRNLLSMEQIVTDTPSDATSTIAQVWAKNEGLIELLGLNPYLSTDMDVDPAAIEDTEELSQNETLLEMRLKGERSFHRSELIFDPRRLQSLANLHYSLEWLAIQTSHLLGTEMDNSGLVATRAYMDSSESLSEYARLSIDSLPKLVPDKRLPLPPRLSAALTQRFSNFSDLYRKLSKTCIYALRIELRCHSMYYLDLAIREGSYNFDDGVADPDPYILMLNVDLSNAEEVVSTELPLRRIRFLFDGLGEIMSHLLIQNLRHIRAVNKNGVQRLTRNVQSLQQNLTNLACIHQQCLDRATAYYALLGLEAEQILSEVEKHPGRFAYDEYKALLDLLFHDVLVGEGPGDKRYAGMLQKLKEYFVAHRD